jgi:hypothetical protein
VGLPRNRAQYLAESVVIQRIQFEVLLIVNNTCKQSHMSDLDLLLWQAIVLTIQMQPNIKTKSIRHPYSDQQIHQEKMDSKETKATVFAPAFHPHASLLGVATLRWPPGTTAMEPFLLFSRLRAQLSRVWGLARLKSKDDEGGRKTIVRTHQHTSTPYYLVLPHTPNPPTTRKPALSEFPLAFPAPYPTYTSPPYAMYTPYSPK